MPTLFLLIGIWATTCIQTQISHNRQGWVNEIYTFEQNGNYEFKRVWHKDPQCTEEILSDLETGSITLGRALSGLFIIGKTFEVNFSNSTGTDLGAISVSEGKSLKVTRGIPESSMRNTMVGLFEYKKQ